VIWYLVTYLWLVLLSPILLRLYRRARLAAIVAPVAVLLVLSVHPVWPANPNYQEVATSILTYAACWTLGFAHRDGSLRRIPGLLVTVLGAALVTAGLAWSWQHPDAGGIKEIPVAYAIYNAGFVLVLLRWSPVIRRSFADNWIALINARAVTIYLWNNVAIALCYPVGDALEVWRLGRFFEIGYVVVALALLADAVLIFGWVEDLAARKSPRFLPWPSRTPVPVRPDPPRGTASGVSSGRAVAPARR
jgi:hypothetical protein